jgi:hypothetical protein
MICRTAVVALAVLTSGATAHADDGSGAAGGSSAADAASGSNASGAGAAGGSSAADAASGSNASGAGAASGSNSAGAAGGSNSAGAAGGSSSPAAGADGGSGSGSAGQLLKIPLEAGAPQVNAAASPTVVNLGGHFTLFVRATFAPGVEVNLREPLDLGAAFEVRRRLSEDEHTVTGMTTREWQLDVTPWEIGDLQLAPITVTFTAFGHAGQVATNPVPLRIVGTLGDLADDTAPRGLAAPTGLTARDWFWIWTATAAGAAAGVVIAALWLHRRRRRRALRLVGGAIARPRRIDMTGARALERLLAIEQSGVLDRDAERKAGYADMVGVIREYLAARFRIATHDRTSAELVAALDGPASPDEVTMVTGWLADCDLVKYGGERATPAEAGKALDDARALIVATTDTGERGAPRAAVVAEAA